MGKNTDKLYITHSEHSGALGAHSATSGISARKNEQQFKKLPFNFCSLSLQPFRDPVCAINSDKTASLFDLRHIVPYVHKHGKNPVSGAPLRTSDLVRLHFARNNDNEYTDPVTHKAFTEHSHIVALRPTGNVYLWDTIDRLNIKTKNWTDLLDSTPFNRNDIITIQDPHNVQHMNLSNFEHLKSNGFKPSEVELSREQRIERAKGSITKLRESQATKMKDEDKSVTSASSSHSLYDRPQSYTNRTTGMTAASFTSTSLTPRTQTEMARKNEQEWLLIPRKITHKGYLQIDTNMGSINVELWPEFAPKAVFNFMMLSKNGYYNNLIFHRNIKNFMIQGGDPSGSGKGGESYWKKNFSDEVKNDLSHDQRGILSMANKGRNTNSSQFFITYAPCKHLDGKHTIFGMVVGGMDTLAKLENLPVDESSRPKDEIAIQSITIYVDPFEEYLLELDAAEEAKKKTSDEQKEAETTTWTGKRLENSNGAGSTDKIGNTGTGIRIGKYLSSSAKIPVDVSATNQQDEATKPEEPVAKKMKKAGFGNFDSW